MVSSSQELGNQEREMQTYMHRVGASEKAKVSQEREMQTKITEIYVFDHDVIQLLERLFEAVSTSNINEIDRLVLGARNYEVFS